MSKDILESCNLCPRNCRANRYVSTGFCKAGSKPKVSLANLHFYEEPCISGKSGSGTIFFAGCNLNCIYCQNYKISQEYSGKEYSIQELSDIMLDLQNKGANNINLVTGFMFVPQIIESIKLAKSNGLNLPIVYNSSGYESVDTIKLLDGYVDVFLPDLKYYYKELSKELSGIQNYFLYAQDAIMQMYNQVGNTTFNENGIIQKGLIIRHLILPNHIQNSKEVLKWIRYNLGKEVYISIMAQYFPTYKASTNNDINRKITIEEYNQIKDYIEELGFENGFMQDYSDEDESKYVPDFL